jgi:hypothetical protein
LYQHFELKVFFDSFVCSRKLKIFILILDCRSEIYNFSMLFGFAGCDKAVWWNWL